MAKKCDPGNAPHQDAEHGEDSLTRLIAPILAGFSLPAIITFVASRYPRAPWHDAVLSFLVAATGLFIASMQLSIGRLYEKYDGNLRFRSFRAFLTILGLILVAFALAFLVWPVVRRWWIWLPLGVLLIGGVGPGAWMLYAKYVVDGHAARRPQ